jgi:hypothetical protein
MISVMRMPVKPVRRKNRRPKRSTKNAVKTLPGKEAVTQRAESRSGIWSFMPRDMYSRTP